MFWWHPGACEILVPWTSIEPMPFPTPYSLPRTLEANSLNHWTAREVLVVAFLITLNTESSGRWKAVDDWASFKIVQ